MFPSIQVQLIDPLPNLLDQTYQESQESSQSSPSSENIGSDINLDFEENSPFQEGAHFRSLSKTRQIILPRTREN